MNKLTNNQKELKKGKKRGKPAIKGKTYYLITFSTNDKRAIDPHGLNSGSPGYYLGQYTKAAARELGGRIISSKINYDTLSIAVELPLNCVLVNFANLVYDKVNSVGSKLSQRNKKRVWYGGKRGHRAGPKREGDAGAFRGFLNHHYASRTIYIEGGELSELAQMQQYHKLDLMRARRARDRRKNLSRHMAHISLTSYASKPFWGKILIGAQEIIKQAYLELGIRCRIHSIQRDHLHTLVELGAGVPTEILQKFKRRISTELKRRYPLAFSWQIAQGHSVFDRNDYIGSIDVDGLGEIKAAQYVARQSEKAYWDLSLEARTEYKALPKSNLKPQIRTIGKANKVNLPRRVSGFKLSAGNIIPDTEGILVWRAKTKRQKREPLEIF